ncbi:hypothetical protein [Streptomyces sp. NPDC005438]|uniref:hypothetical protein n=1 Tax=Streptomyces sp. NPDC005438 TaxID=3156880 RepID=UPI0033B745BD
MLNINLAFFLTVIVVLRLRRRTEARSRADERMTVAIVLLLGVLIAPTEFGQGLVRATGQLLEQVARVRL